MTSSTHRRKKSAFLSIQMVSFCLCELASVPHVAAVTFLKVSVDGLDLVWKAGGAALHFHVPRGLRIDFNDLAGKAYRKVTSIRLRQGIIRLLLASGPNQSSWLEAAHTEVDCCVDLYSAPKGWEEAARNQAKFVVEQDIPTGRAKQLIMLHGWTQEFRRESEGLLPTFPRIIRRMLILSHYSRVQSQRVPLYRTSTPGGPGP